MNLELHVLAKTWFETCQVLAKSDKFNCVMTIALCQSWYLDCPLDLPSAVIDLALSTGS